MKVFRFHSGNENIEDWGATSSYGKTEIDGISDPTGGSARRQITSIPSPFARIDLVRTAFRYVCDSKELEGNTIYHKIVSDCLDIGQIFFHIDQFKDKIRIITWDKQNNLQQLINSSNAKHRLFGETLKLYLEQDAGAYHFDKLERLYLLEYNHKLIGGTSPATLFFTSANKLDFVDINFGNSKVFDENYCPLYKREPEYQEYLYHYFRACPDLGQRLKDVQDYLEANKTKLDSYNHDLYNKINTLNPEDFEKEYDEADTGKPGDVLEIIGCPMRKQKQGRHRDSATESDFVIKSAKYSKELKPLVLQNALNKKMRYTSDLWNKDIVVPNYNPEQVLENRRLPGLTVDYPYLTVSDFLEPYLIRVVYPIYKEKYFDGNLIIDGGSDKKSYLLPIRRRFFEFFDTKDLMTTIMYDGKPMFEMHQVAGGGVDVTLRIPVKKDREYINFNRLYSPGSETEITPADEAGNQGRIIENQFGITVFPFLKTGMEDISAFYRIQLIDRDIAGLFKGNEYKLNFYRNEAVSNNTITATKQRSFKLADNVGSAGTQYYVLNDEFDYIQVSHNTASAIIIPKWPDYHPGSESFSFSIDFGTTNTHIEYRVGATRPQPFDIKATEMQIATLFDPNKTDASFAGSGAFLIRELIPHEFLPATIGNGSLYKLPQRTVIAESLNINIQKETFTLGDFNIPFTYEKKKKKGKITTNLKWAKKEEGNQKRITAFFEKLIMLIRNKVLLNNGNLAETKLIWFYPSSMKPGKIADMQEIWTKLYKSYINPNQEPYSLTEAIAPFYYYRQARHEVTAASRPVVSVDIGGGTSDVVIFTNEKPYLVTSFRFAANAIFGDGFSETGMADTNGLTQKYYKYFTDLLTHNEQYDALEVLKEIYDERRSDDLNTFFFSLEGLAQGGNADSFSYNKLLAKDEDVKIVFVYFYAAILYHIARLMKFKNLEVPRNLLFSGTGSKILNIISSDYRLLAEYAILVFEKVYGEKYHEDGLTIVMERDVPKEVTCKGGLMAQPDEIEVRMKDLKMVYTMLDEDPYTHLTYQEIGKEEVNEKLVNEVKKFNELFRQLDKPFSYAENFNVADASMDLFYKEYNKSIKDNLLRGKNHQQRADGQQIAPDKEIEETLFFHPITGCIISMLNSLSNLSPVNH
jgi:hypothetical protein